MLLPTLPSVPQAMAWAAMLAPVVWTGGSYTLLGIVNPGLRDGVSWPWFVLSQFVYGVVVALVASIPGDPELAAALMFPTAVILAAMARELFSE